MLGYRYGAATHDEPRVLSQAPQNDIPAKLAAWRAARHLPGGASLQDARAADPSGWQDLEADLIAVVIGMPLAKLQRFGDGRHTTEDRFIYDFSWREEIGRHAVARPDFDDSLRLRPSADGWLIRLAPLIRPLVQAKWAARVAARNSDLTDTGRLDEFLFGAQRISLQRVRGPLAEVQGRDCFYGDGHLGARCAVDHFLPWSRHPDNTIDNLVAAHHPRCNNAKSASLASLDHLQRWLTRFQPGTPGQQRDRAHRIGDRMATAVRPGPVHSPRHLPMATRTNPAMAARNYLRTAGHNKNARLVRIRDMSPVATSATARPHCRWLESALPWWADTYAHAEWAALAGAQQPAAA